MSMLLTVSPAITLPPPPPGTNYVAVISSALLPLLLSVIGGSFLVPITIAIFFFSKQSTRKSLMFWCNVIIISLGISATVISAYTEIQLLVFPLKQIPVKLVVAYAIHSGLITFMVELILLLRILAIYSFNSTPRVKFAAVMAFPVIMKVARFINLVLFFNKFITTFKTAGLYAGVVPYSIIEWFLSAVDNLYTSAIFLIRLNYRPFFSNTSSLQSGNITLASKFRALFWIAVSNFVFPVFFAIPQAILAVVIPQQYVTIAYVNIARLYVSIIAVVFATLWASGSSWYSENVPNGTDLLSTFRARKPDDMEAINFQTLVLKPDEAGGNSEQSRLSTQLSEESSSRGVDFPSAGKEGCPLKLGIQSANF